MKISFQIAACVLMLALIYTGKCEFAISETSPRMRFVTLMAAPVFVSAFAISTVICYYAKVNTVFSYLVDSLICLSLCGFVVCSYTPCKQAKPLCDAKWDEYDDELYLLNTPEYSEVFGEDDPADTDESMDSVTMPGNADVTLTYGEDDSCDSSDSSDSSDSESSSNGSNGES